MRRTFISLAMALAALCSVTVFASAAGADAGITVQLDGQALEFTDAKPQVVESRTFLPFRSVFEAMGAQVSADGNVITAVRGDTELTMTIGETDAQIRRSDAVETLPMDVAPYVDSATWRTYVPVRFAADAFGCSVGWDQAEQTVVIVDTETLVRSALSGKEFTLLEKLMAFNGKYSTGNWAMDGTCTAAVSLLGSDAIPVLSGSVSGITSGETAAEMSMDLDMDLTELMTALIAGEDVSLADLGVTSEDLQMAMSMDLKMDLDAGTFYCKLNDEWMQAAGLPAGTWLSLDLGSMMAEDLADSTLTDMEPDALLRGILSTVSLDDRAGDGYAFMSTALNELLTAFSDEGFLKTGDGYETAYLLEPEEFGCGVMLDLSTTSAGDVNGYAFTFVLSIPVEDADALLGEYGMLVDELDLVLTVSMDAQGSTDIELYFGATPLFDMGMTMDMNYRASSTAPDVSLPAGASVMDYADYLAGLITIE